MKTFFLACFLLLIIFKGIETIIGSWKLILGKDDLFPNSFLSKKEKHRRYIIKWQTNNSRDWSKDMEPLTFSERKK